MTYHASDEGYFNWLYLQIEPTSNQNPARTHSLLAEQMFKTEFRWSVPNDDNRVEDARELRMEFMDNYAMDDRWMRESASVLEVILALSRRVTFEAGGEPSDWFWKLVSNLGLWEYTDENYSDWVAEKVDVALEIFIDREYDHDGEGGLFPLQHTTMDQTEIELWYQMSYYLLEGNGVD